MFLPFQDLGVIVFIISTAKVLKKFQYIQIFEVKSFGILKFLTFRHPKSGIIEQKTEEQKNKKIAPLSRAMQYESKKTLI